MTVIQWSDEEGQQPSAVPLNLFPVPPLIQKNDLFTLITDFFDWLETAWLLPLFQPDLVRPLLPLPLTLTEEHYTASELVRLCGCTFDWLYCSLERFQIISLGYVSYLSPVGAKGLCRAYRKQDLVPLLEQWEWKQLTQVLHQWWLRFFPPACGTCTHCREGRHLPMTQQFCCARCSPLTTLRTAFSRFLQELRRAGNVTVWWQSHQTGSWSKTTRSAWGILVIYLLDRRLVHLSIRELVQFAPICHKDHLELTRLWRNRCPEEYAQFVHAMHAANYRNNDVQGKVFAVVGLLLLLNYGLSSLTCLERPLSAEELQQVCRDRRLVTLHLGHGAFLPYPLTPDICVGHVLLDDIRFFFWQYAAQQAQKGVHQHWSRGPHGWEQMVVRIIEQALAAPVYKNATAIISRRPETEHSLHNPWFLTYQGEQADTGYALLPIAVQEQIMAYLTHCHQEQHMELTTMQTRAHALMTFFTWLRRQGKLVHYPHFSRERAQALFREYASLQCAEVKAATRRTRFTHLAHFFATLANLGYPVPVGYRLLYTFEKHDPHFQRAVPREEIMDRVFREGVCRLSYDPLARLALTIQYYCGTRVSETCDLHVFCILEDRDGHAYLLIPKGKAKEERPFPIVELGMGPLLEYMDEVVALRLSPDGTSRTLGKTNFRYLDDDPERARDWHYLFDRTPHTGSVLKRT